MLIKRTCSNVTSAVLQAIEQGEREIVFEKGEYHFYQNQGIERFSCISNHDNDGVKHVGIQIEDVDKIVIDGNGSDFVFHGIMLPISVDHSANVELRNFSVNFPVTAYVHSTVVDASERFCDIKLWENTPYRMREDIPLFSIDGEYEFMYNNALEFNSELECIEYGTNDRDYFTHSSADEISEGILRIKHKFDVVPRKGNYMFFRLGERFAPGIFINKSNNIKIDGVTIHHCLGMGILAQLSQDIHIHKLKIVPSDKRFVSAYADGVHFVECSGNILVEKCHIEKQMDDFLNCHGIYAQVSNVEGNIVYVKLRHYQALGMLIFERGDKVEYIDCQTLLSYGGNEIISSQMCSDNLIKLVMNNKPSVKIGDYLENVSHTPDLTVRDCYFGKNRARGLLITTRGKVLIENNCFERSGSAIRISGDCNFWFESGCVKDVTIRNNKFIDLNANSRWGQAVIDIAPEVKHPQGAVHKNICIEDNLFQTFDIPLLWANCAEKIVFRNNKVIKTDTFKPKGLLSNPVTLTECYDCIIE